MVRPVSGKAGHAIVKSLPSASRRASATGPMLPLSVLSKVEQYLKWIWRAPARRSQASASSDRSTASSGGQVRDFSATTTASASGMRSPSGGVPIAWTVRIPPLTSVLQRSVAPVKSSATAPSSIGMSASRRWQGSPLHRPDENGTTKSPRPPSRRRSRLGAGSARRTREENHARTAERGAAGEPLGAAHLRRRLHDDDRQPPVQLDAVRAADEQGARLGDRRHPV